MRLVRPTHDLVTQYRSFWEKRGVSWPGRPRHGIWIVDGEQLVAAVGAILCEDHFVVLEGYATNPEASHRKRHEAALFALESIRSLAMMLDRTVIMLPSPGLKGAERLARRYGFVIGSTSPIFGVFR